MIWTIVGIMLVNWIRHRLVNLHHSIASMSWNTWIWYSHLYGFNSILHLEETTLWREGIDTSVILTPTWSHTSRAQYVNPVADDEEQKHVNRIPVSSRRCYSVEDDIRNPRFADTHELRTISRQLDTNFPIFRSYFRPKMG